jgi:predicted Zn finger-like uncharacterized protein
LFTVCPKCTLTLVVTTVDLRAGQGYVRCGRCANVFNALIALREGDPNNLSDTASRRLQETAPRPSVEPALGAGVHVESEPEPEPEPEPEAADDGILVEESSGDESLEFDPIATDVSEIFIQPMEAEHDTGSGSYEAVVLAEEPSDEAPADESAVPDDESHVDTIASDDWSLLDDEPADAESVIEEPPLASDDANGEAAPVTPHRDDPQWIEEMFAEAEQAQRARATPRELPDARAEEHMAEEDMPEEDRAEPSSPPAPSAPSDAALGALLSPASKRRPPWQYVAGVVALALLFVAQIVHFNRQSLVLSSVGPLVSKVYGWLGATLTPRWDLTAYSVKQLGAEAEGTEGTRLRVRLSLQNESARVQPLPLLRLTLQDRFGNAVATRDLEPAEYLPKRVANQRLLEPDQRIDAELHVIDPGKAAIGFEIDACLRGESGAIGCANEIRRRSAG